MEYLDCFFLSQFIKSIGIGVCVDRITKWNKAERPETDSHM